MNTLRKKQNYLNENALEHFLIPSNLTTKTDKAGPWQLFLSRLGQNEHLEKFVD